MALLSVLAQYRNAGVILVAVGLATYIGIRKLKYDEMVLLRTGTLLLWNERLQFNSHFFLGFVDMILITSAYWGAFLLKYEDPLPKVVVTWYLNTYPLVLVAQLAVFYALGLYRGAWRVAEVRDLMRIALVVPPAVALSYIIAVLREPPPGTLGFFWIDALVLGACVAGIRSAYKHLVAYAWPRDDADTGTALIYGADRHGQLILRELLQNPHIGLLPIGFLDDDVTLQGQIVNRMPGIRFRGQSEVCRRRPTSLYAYSRCRPCPRLSSAQSTQCVSRTGHYHPPRIYTTGPSENKRDGIFPCMPCRATRRAEFCTPMSVVVRSSSPVCPIDIFLLFCRQTSDNKPLGEPLPAWQSLLLQLCDNPE